VTDPYAVLLLLAIAALLAAWEADRERDPRRVLGEEDLDLRKLS